MSTPSSQSPVILFLQGPPSGFWPELAAEFERRGARTIRINFSVGDWVYWGRKGAINYRDSPAQWPAYLRRLIEAEAVTDIIYYTDRLPYHVEAAEIASELGLNAYSIEFGYLRPDWLTLEKGGMGSYSHFPKEPDAIRRIASQVGSPDLTVRYSHTFLQEAFNEVLYNLLSYFGKPFFHRYKADKYYDPFFEYLMWLPRALKSDRARKQAARIGREALQWPFWLLAMQLQSDYQVRANSHYPHLRDMLEEVIGSFASHADKADYLVVKLHPLDNGFEGWETVAGGIAARHKVRDRLRVMDGGDLNALIAAARGVIVVNSTVGLHSIQALRPTKVLGMAVYDIDGLTHQGALDTFWNRPAPVDATLARDLVQALAATIQLKGNFYNPAGRAVGVREIAARVLAGTVNEPGAFIVPPPRLAEALRRRTGAKLPGMGSLAANGQLADSQPPQSIEVSEAVGLVALTSPNNILTASDSVVGSVGRGDHSPRQA